MYKLVGYADKHIAKQLKLRGALVVGSATFFVEGKDGPLKNGEIDRAGRWAKTILTHISPGHRELQTLQKADMKVAKTNYRSSRDDNNFLY
jgi:hypothetical protein